MTVTAPVTPDLLAAIVAATRRAVEVRSAAVPMTEMERRAALAGPVAGRFRQAITRDDRFNVIAECKRRSPSRGVLRSQYDPVSIARGYEANGAAAISVLTEATFFDGSLEHLAAVRRAVAIPLLRKDFIIDRYQILEARAAGADAILLIGAALSPSQLRTLHTDAIEVGLDVLVEIHEPSELPAALDGGASIVGVNNRNLRTLTVDTTVSERIIEMLPPGVVAVAESGLKNGEDLRRLQRRGYRAFLIGERLMAVDEPGRALGELLEEAGQ